MQYTQEQLLAILNFPVAGNGLTSLANQLIAATLNQANGAARHCDSRQRMLDAWKLVTRYAKPNDAFVVGMFPKYKEQVNENCELMVEAMKANAA